jgi:hypothetical protein
VSRCLHDLLTKLGMLVALLISSSRDKIRRGLEVGLITPRGSRSYGNVMNVRCSLAIGRNCLKTRRRELIDVQLRDQRDDWLRHVFGAMFAASRESADSSGFSTLNPTAMSLTYR